LSDQGLNKASIALPLHGIESLDSPIGCPVRIEDKIWKPPSYMVRLALSVAGFRVGWPDEKVTWSSFMRYKDVGFEVRDWKRSTWTIEADRADAEALEVAAELRKKIVTACSILDRQLTVLRKQEIEDALGDQSIDYFAFRNMKWRERVCHVLPVGTDPELGKLHSRLLRIKYEVRDRMLHGLGGQESILLPTPGLGLVPLSFEHIDSMNMFSWVPFSEEVLEDVPNAFDELDDWLTSHQPWRDYVMLAKSMLPIPLFGDRRQEILDALGEDFEDWIHSEQEHEDYILNHWD